MPIPAHLIPKTSKPAKKRGPTKAQASAAFSKDVAQRLAKLEAKVFGKPKAEPKAEKPAEKVIEKPEAPGLQVKPAKKAD